MSLLLAAFFVVRAAADMQEGDGDCEVLLLQSSAELMRRVQPEEALEQPAPQALALESALPLIFVHVPKTGSSLINALVRVPGVCPEFAEELGADSFSDVGPGEQLEDLAGLQCPGLNAPGTTGPSDAEIGDHMPLGDDSHFQEHYAGHAVTMLRQPEQRVISGLRHHAAMHPEPTDFESLQYSEGCAVRMLVGEDLSFSHKGSGCFGMHQDDPPLPELSSEDVARAVARLQSFAFVGITEQWPLSVCLLHAMFGGECVAVEFGNTRIGHGTRLTSQPTVYEAPEQYDTGFFNGWVDAADRALYDAGLDLRPAPARARRDV